MLFALSNQAAVAFLYLQIKEYALPGVYDAAAASSTYITSLSFNTFLSTDTTKYCNFTYTASTSSTYQSNVPSNNKPFYNSTCFDGTVTGATTTATVAQFVTFDSVNIYYNNTLYMSVTPATASKYGVTPSDFFKGTVNTNFVWSSASLFADIATALHGNAPKLISTVGSQLFIAKFQGDYSYLTITVVDKTLGTTNCTMVWTSLNESVCKLGQGNFILYGKDAKGKIMIKYPFTRTFYDAAVTKFVVAAYSAAAATAAAAGATADNGAAVDTAAHAALVTAAATNASFNQYMASAAYTTMRATVTAAATKALGGTAAATASTNADAVAASATQTVSNADQAISRQLIPYTLPIIPATTTTDFKSNPVQQTTFYINMNDTSYKTAVDLTDQTCANVTTTITSNGSTIFSGYTQGYCYLSITSSTAALVPWTDFIINATYTNGTSYLYTKARLTPRMISDWASNSLNTSTVVVTLTELNKSGLTGGEIAAIVIGSCAGAFFVALLGAILIRWCAYGCMTPAMVAAPKMMM